MQRMRDIKGRIIGTFDEWFDHYNVNEDNWEDYKEYDVRFPETKENRVYPVHTYSITDLQLIK